MIAADRTLVGEQGADAPFALVGVIVRLGAATMSIITPDELTAVMRVESVVRAPETLADLTGAEITVELDAPADEGQRLLLFAAGWMYGDSVAVREVARGEPDAEGDVRIQFERQVKEAPVEHLGGRAKEADTVVLGTVRELRPIKRSGEDVPPSEHDPDWWVAVIAVEDVAKGRKPRGGRLEVLYANSRDVQWFQAPKPEPGQNAVFLLRRETRFDAPKNALVLIDAADLQPREHFDEIRRLALGEQ